MREYCRKVWLGFYTALLGMKVTLKYFFSPAITLQYPDQRWEIPEGSRGKLYCDMDDCIGCLACARACPVDCITIETKKAPPGVDMGKTSDGTKKKLVVPVFDINLTTCLYCGLCVEACPTGCIRMTKDYEYSVYDRSQLLLSFGRDLDPAVVAAAAEKVAAEKAAAEKAAAEAGADAATGKSGAAAEKSGTNAAAEAAPEKPAPSAVTGKSGAAAEKSGTNGAATGPEKSAPGAATGKSGAAATPEKSASKGSSPDGKTAPPPGDSKTPSE